MSRVRVSKIGAGVAEADLRDFLSFSGAISEVAWESQVAEDGTKSAVVTFTESHAADTAQVLTGAMLGETAIEISRMEENEAALDVGAASMTALTAAGSVATDMVAMMLAAGYKLSETAAEQAKAFDESAKVSANLSAFDEQYKLSATAREVTSTFSVKANELDAHLKISETANAASAAAVAKATEISEHPSLAAAASAVTAGISWLNAAVSDVATKANERYQAANPVPIGMAPDAS